MSGLGTPMLVWRFDVEATVHHQACGGRSSAWTLHAIDGAWQRRLVTVYRRTQPTRSDAERVWERQRRFWRRACRTMVEAELLEVAR